MSSPRGEWMLAPIYVPQDGAPAIPDVVTLSVLELTDDERSTIGSYWNAVGKFINANDSTDLDEYRGATVGGYELVTDYDDLWELDYEGELNPDEIYEGLT